MKNKSIIISFILLFLASAVFLAWRETKLASPQSQNWWSIYFTSAKDNGLDFIIENNSNQSNFHWEATAEKSPFQNGDIEIAKGGKKEIKITKPDTESFGNLKFTITVTTENNKKEIYKIF